MLMFTGTFISALASVNGVFFSYGATAEKKSERDCTVIILIDARQVKLIKHIFVS